MMNLRKLFYIAAVILAAASCKKDNASESYPSLNGSIKVEGLPEFIAPEQAVRLTAKGAEHPAKGELGYYWKVSPTMNTYDTTDVFSHVFSDTLRTYTVYCYAYAEGYSGLSTSLYTTAVAPGYNGSIRGIKYNKIAEDSVYVRHMPYYYKTIGTQTWTLNNMAVRSGMPFRNAEVMSEVFGRYYNFEEAKAACDSLDTDGQNWELPSMEDWATLETYINGNIGGEYGKTISAAMMVDAKFNETTMWEYWFEVGDLKNSSGFSAISTGYANVQAKSFDGEFEYAAFWTSDEATQTEGYYKYLICDQPGLFTGKGNKQSFGASVRCIRK